jgi:3-dehydroquinate dehydratase/shikimate dehydrogenase
MAIVVSHIAPDFDTLARQVTRQAKLADLIELRLDHIGDPGEERLRALIREAKKPTIVTVQGPEAFGHFQGSLDQRLEILRSAARAGASFVDIDASASLDLGEMPGKCHRIVSCHVTDHTPEDLESLHAEIERVQYEGDLIKLVTHAQSCEDALRLLAFVRQIGGGLIGFCSGEKGRFTRILAPIFGSPFTYAAPAIMPGLPEPPATAPGQIRVNDLRGLLPPTGLTAETAIFAVVGNPIGHSWSPRVHGMALKAAHLDAVYVALEPDDFKRFLALTTDSSYRGFSVTAPFKELAAQAGSSRDSAVEATHAANTLIREARGWRALNTDVTAIQETLERAFKLHGSTPGRPVSAGLPASLGAAHTLVLGTGGAARAALHAVKQARGRASVSGRDPVRTQSLAREMSCNAVAWDEIPKLAYDVLVHCTPMGSLADPGKLALPADWIRPASLVLDAVYRPIKTPLLVEAMKRGSTAVPGGEWFVRQARMQFKLFTGQDPDEPLMRAAFEHALAEDRK